MYTYSEYVECREHKLSKLVGPMTLALVMSGPGGIDGVANPTTVVGLLDAAVILLHTNGFTEEQIKQAVREHYDRVATVISDTEAMKAKAKVKMAEMQAKRRLKQQRIGAEVPDSELPPAPALATEPVSEPAEALDNVEWPTNES